MQLVSKALEGLLPLASASPSLRGMIIPGLFEATKYVVPSPNHLGIKVTNATRPFIRPPHPVMTIEYTMDITSPGGAISNLGVPTRPAKDRIALIIDLSTANKWTDVIWPVMEYRDGFMMMSIYRTDNDGEWSFAPGFAIFNPVDDTSLDANDKMNEGTVVARMFPEFSQLSIEVLINDLAEEYFTTIRTLALLNARNITTIEIPVSEKLNRKRRSRLRVPFYTYKILDVFLSPETIRKVRSRDLQGAINSFAGSKRLHTVRGHFKHRKSGIFFWREHQRGTKTQGVVEKQYNLIPETL